MHVKRNAVPKSWPIVRKGTKYVVIPKSGEIPLLVVLRDMLKIAKNAKEVKKAIHQKDILVNEKPINDEKKGLFFFDSLTIAPLKKSYRLVLASNGKFSLDEIKESETSKKVAKIIGKKKLKGNKIQINLSDGNNFISETKCKVNDSALIDVKNKKIEKHLPIKEGAHAVIFSGKHVGKSGTIKKINLEKNDVEISSDKETLTALIKQIMVTQ